MEFGLPPELEKLVAALDQPKAILRRVSQNLAEETVDLIKQGFRDQKDPYGHAWKPKKAQDGRMTLSGPTSRLKGGWHIKQVSDSGFIVAPSVTYADYHQQGGRHLPRRMMVPDAGIGLPSGWKRAYDETATDVLAEVFRR
jgi:phage gpG-like protein